MRTKLNKIIMTLAILLAIPSMALGQTKKQIKSWDRVINAIIQVESGGNPKARNPIGDCCGILQITKICIDEANLILQEKKINKKFTSSDRWNVEKSKEIFVLIQEKYNPEHDVVKACRIWNEGPHYNRKIKKTKYTEKVLKKLK